MKEFSFQCGGWDIAIQYWDKGNNTVHCHVSMIGVKEYCFVLDADKDKMDELYYKLHELRMSLINFYKYELKGDYEK